MSWFSLFTRFWVCFSSKRLKQAKLLMNIIILIMCFLHLCCYLEWLQEKIGGDLCLIAIKKRKHVLFLLINFINLFLSRLCSSVFYLF